MCCTAAFGKVAFWDFRNPLVGGGSECVVQQPIVDQGFSILPESAHKFRVSNFGSYTVFSSSGHSERGTSIVSTL